MLKSTLVAFVVSFAVSGIAAAQTAPAQTGDSATSQAQEPQRKVAPHEHPRDAKQGAAASRTAGAQEKRKPLHDHRKEHKL